MTRVWKRMTVGLALAAVAGGGTALPASAEARIFVGHGTSQFAAQALQRAASRAQANAAAAGATACEEFGENFPEFDPKRRIWEATFRLQCDV